MDYQPISEPSNMIAQVFPRCKSASHAQESVLRTHVECHNQDSISLPGQLNLDTATGDIRQNAKLLAASKIALSKESDEMNVEGSISEEAHTSPATAQTPDDTIPAKLDSFLEGGWNDMEGMQLHKNSEHSILGDSFSDEIQGHDDQISWGSITSSSTQSLTNLTITHIETTQSLAKSITLVLYMLCALFVYPLFFTLTPFLLVFKFIFLLFSCIPCRRKHNTQITGKQKLPLFFTSRRLGGYHTIGVELSEQMEGESFIEYVIMKLNDAYCDDNTMKQSMVFRLASVIRQVACFSWWELGENVKLEDHIQIINKRITTVTDFTNFIEQLSRKEAIGNRKPWQIYFFPFFKTRSSSVALHVHHSLLSEVNLKDTLLCDFSDSFKTNGKSSFAAKTVFPHPAFVETVLTGPGIVLKHILRPSLCRLRTSNKLHFTYSCPMRLSEACLISNQCSVSLHTLFMAPLSQSLRNLFAQKNRVRVAIPVASSTGHYSAFFMHLPMTKLAWDCARLQNIEKEICKSSKDAYILLSAAKLASLVLSPCTVDLLASSVLRQADVLFDVVYCPNTPHYLENHVISSVTYWPPLFNQIGVGVCVVVHESSFRVCIVTDHSVTEWPEILLKLFIASYSEFYRAFST